MRRIMIDEFKIGGLQNFFNYSKINPINIQIKDSEIQNALAFYSSRYKYRFIANNLFILSIQQDTNAIFLTTNGLNDANDILISWKLVKGIGVIYLSEISGRKSIKKTSHSANAVFSNSDYPVAVKHFVFGFEMTHLHSLLNFEYSLLDHKGKQIKFKKAEDKTPALSFTIQIIS